MLSGNIAVSAIYCLYVSETKLDGVESVNFQIIKID